MSVRRQSRGCSRTACWRLLIPGSRSPPAETRRNINPVHTGISSTPRGSIGCKPRLRRAHKPAVSKPKLSLAQPPARLGASTPQAWPRGRGDSRDKWPLPQRLGSPREGDKPTQTRQSRPSHAEHATIPGFGKKSTAQTICSFRDTFIGRIKPCAHSVLGIVRSDWGRDCLDVLLLKHNIDNPD